MFGFGHLLFGENISFFLLSFLTFIVQRVEHSSQRHLAARDPEQGLLRLPAHSAVYHGQDPQAQDGGLQ
jgi:hypothetical protein